MAQDKNDSVGARIRREMKEMESRLKDLGFDRMEIQQLMRDYFVKATPKKKQPVKKMTAARGGMAKKKMMRGGSVQPKRMRGGGMAKMAKKKMMRGGAVKKK
jgi:hypothetical protein